MIKQNYTPTADQVAYGVAMEIVGFSRVHDIYPIVQRAVVAEREAHERTKREWEEDFKVRTLLLAERDKALTELAAERAAHEETKKEMRSIASRKRNAAPVWTKDKPTKEGWYWVRAARYPAQIRRFWASKIEQKYQVQPVDGPYSTEGWEEFAGPIPKP